MIGSVARNGEAAVPATPRSDPVVGRDDRAAISIVGLLGARVAAVLARAGRPVSYEDSLEYAQLRERDLLVLAPAPPEPPASDLVRHLCQRVSVPVLAVVPDPADVDLDGPEATLIAGCLAADSSDAELLATVDAVLEVGSPDHGAEQPARAA